MPRQHEYIFAPLTQGRQAQANHVEAVKQVFPKAAFLDALLQVLVRGGNHAHIGLDGVVATDAVKMPVRQHAQQPCLQVKRHVANFIEEQRAAIGLLEAAAPHGLRAGEGAALMAEQFALQQVLRDGRRVDGDEGPVGPRRVLVQRTRHQLLARAGFAGNHHRHVALAQAANRTEHILHGRCLAQHFRGGRHALFGHFLALAFFDRTANQLHRLDQVKGLGQVFECAALKGGHRAIQIGKRRHDDDRQAGQLFLDLFQQVQARAAGHADIAHENLRPLFLGGVLQCRQHFTRVGETARRQVLAQQGLFQNKPDGLVIVNDPNRFHVSPSLLCRLNDR